MMHIYIADTADTMDPTTRTEVYTYFGSVGQSILTLYQSASGGIDWAEVYIVVAKSGTIAATGFIFFIWFFNFAVVNILSGIFIEKALEAAVPDREQLALDKRRAEQRDVNNLTELITAMDEDSNGNIS